jgi:hypothetical protein
MGGIMTIRQLESGYWFAYWSPQEFAQWHGAYPRREDFFHPSWSFSEARVHECERAVLALRSQSTAQAHP